MQNDRFGLRPLARAYVVTGEEEKEVFSPKGKVAKPQNQFPRMMERIGLKQRAELLTQVAKGKLRNYAKIVNDKVDLNSEQASETQP